MLFRRALSWISQEVGQVGRKGTAIAELDAGVVRNRLEELYRFNHHDQALELLRHAFETGLDPYFALDIVALVWDKQGAEPAAAEIGRLAGLLTLLNFSFQGDAFHKDIVERALEGLMRVIAYEQGQEHDPAALAAGLADHVRAMVWPRLWQLARVQDKTRIGRMAVLYPHVYGSDPLQSLLAVESFLSVYGFWSEALDVLNGIATDSTTPRGLLAQRWAWLVEAHGRLDNFTSADQAFGILFEMLDRDGWESAFADADLAEAAVRASWSKYNRLSAAEDIPAIDLYRNHVARLADWLGQDERPTRFSASHEQFVLLLAHVEEDLGHVDEAERLYLKGSEFLPDTYLPDRFWRCSVFLSAQGRWAEAARIQAAGVLALWPHYDPVAQRPGRARYESGEVLPKHAVVLNCEGIGDDLWRVIMMIRLQGFYARYAFVVDDRLQSCLQRAWPEFEFLVRARCAGSHAVDVETYHRDRIGVPLAADSTRITQHIMDKIKEYGEVCLSEDVFYEYFRKRGQYEHTVDRPWLKPDPAHASAAVDWVGGLPAGNINVGISWRSGLFNPFRNRGHFRIEELGDLFRVQGVNWVVLQYLHEEAELAHVERTFGVKLHLMPGVDLKDDIDKVVALAGALDLVVATPSTIEPLSAAAGAQVISLGPGYYSISQFRIAEDGETDRALPNVKVLTARRYQTKAAIAAEAGRRVAAFRDARRQEA